MAGTARPLLPVLAMLAGLEAGATPAAQPAISLQALDHRLVEMASGPEQRHIRSDAEWQAFWSRYQPARPAPRIDFKQYDLLVALMGTQPSGGYSVHIGQVEPTGQGAQVRLLYCRPDTSAAQLTEVTAPHDTRLVPKLRAPVHWNIVNAVTGQGECRK